MMKLRVSGQGMLVLLVGVSLSSCGVASDQNPHQEAAAVDNRAAEEAKIRSVDAEWVKAVARKDAQQTATYYTEGSALMAPGAPLAAGKEAIQKTWAGLMGTAGFSLTFAPTKIEVSRSGDLAYEVGDYELTTNDKKGKPQSVKAKYVVVWGKQADGSWKALVDAPTTTQ